MTTTSRPKSVNQFGPAALKQSGELTAEDLENLAEATARELLGISAEAAFSMLDRGELEGTLAGGTLSSLRWLAAS